MQSTSGLGTFLFRYTVQSVVLLYSWNNIVSVCIYSLHFQYRCGRIFIASQRVYMARPGKKKIWMMSVGPRGLLTVSSPAFHVLYPFNIRPIDVGLLHVARCLNTTQYCIIWIVNPGAYFQKGVSDNILAHKKYIVNGAYCWGGGLTFGRGLTFQIIQYYLPDNSYTKDC